MTLKFQLSYNIKFSYPKPTGNMSKEHTEKPTGYKFNLVQQYLKGKKCLDNGKIFVKT